MVPFQTDPSWYESHWLTERPPSRWMRLRNRFVRRRDPVWIDGGKWTA